MSKSGVIFYLIGCSILSGIIITKLLSPYANDQTTYFFCVTLTIVGVFGVFSLVLGYFSKM
jgi:hypothetical protein